MALSPRDSVGDAMVPLVDIAALVQYHVSIRVGGDHLGSEDRRRSISHSHGVPDEGIKIGSLNVIITV